MWVPFPTGASITKISIFMKDIFGGIDLMDGIRTRGLVFGEVWFCGFEVITAISQSCVISFLHVEASLFVFVINLSL